MGHSTLYVRAIGQRYTWSEVLQFLRVFGLPRNLQPHYNIAPTMTVDVIRLDESGRRELVPMRWGLIPAWWVKSLKEIPATFNARAESRIVRRAWSPGNWQPARLRKSSKSGARPRPAFTSTIQAGVRSKALYMR